MRDTHFSVVRVGASGDGDLNLPRAVLAMTTLVDIDGGDPGHSGVMPHRYHQCFERHDCIGDGTWANLTINAFRGSSSILAPDAEQVAAYGIERYYTPESVVSMQSRRLSFVLGDLGVHDVDLLKIDTEGMDWAIARDFFKDQCAAGRIVPRVVQMELRWQPFYAGEPHASAVIETMRRWGYDLVSLRHTDHWLYAPHGCGSRGRAVWSDCVFAHRDYSDNTVLGLAACGMRNMARHVLGIIAKGGEPDALLLSATRPTWRDFKEDVRNALRPLELAARHLLRRSRHATWH